VPNLDKHIYVSLIRKNADIKNEINEIKMK